METSMTPRPPAPPSLAPCRARPLGLTGSPTSLPLGQERSRGPAGGVAIGAILVVLGRIVHASKSGGSDSQVDFRLLQPAQKVEHALANVRHATNGRVAHLGSQARHDDIAVHRASGGLQGHEGPAVRDEGAAHGADRDRVGAVLVTVLVEARVQHDAGAVLHERESHRILWQRGAAQATTRLRRGHRRGHQRHIDRHTVLASATPAVGAAEWRRRRRRLGNPVVVQVVD
mmetsp:Transcript_64577/g.187129  ORF Transcript_64577/g.187129 Transcript_64577/m.187129 type:complete len:230 (-) Transcript_64577:367-1056(-)